MTDDDDDMAEEYLAHALMNETRDYIVRGRAYAATEEQQLRDQWIALFRNVLVDRNASRRRNFEDVEAEFRLREIEPPYDQVSDELEKFREEEIARGPVEMPPSLQRSIEDFLIERAKRKH